MRFTTITLLFCLLFLGGLAQPRYEIDSIDIPGVSMADMPIEQQFQEKRIPVSRAKGEWTYTRVKLYGVRRCTYDATFDQGVMKKVVVSFKISSKKRLRIFREGLQKQFESGLIGDDWIEHRRKMEATLFWRLMNDKGETVKGTLQMESKILTLELKLVPEE